MGIGNLPDGWTFQPLETVLGDGNLFVDGDWVESKDQDPNGDVRLIQLADIGDGSYRNRSDRFLTYEKAIELGCTFLEKGDLLVARMPDPLGRACIFPGDSKKAVTVVDVCVIRTNQVSHRWLMHAINSPQFRADVESLQSGSTRKRISRKNLEKVGLPVPPLPEQERIVAKIEELFTQLEAGAAALKRVRAGLKRYKASVLKAACEGRLLNDEGRIENDGELPDGWRWTTVGEIGEISGGLTKNSKRDILPKKLPYLRVANVYANELRLDKISEIGIEENEIQRTLLKDGDLLVVEGNGSADQIGRVALWNGSISPCLHQNHIIKVRFEPKEVAEYVLYWLLSDGGREQITRVASSTSGLYTLSLSKVANLKVPLPPLAEQRRIVAEVERRLSVAQEVESVVAASVARAGRLRQSVLKSAFEGKY
jgi:type I restriction enzyme S subunit